MCAREARVPPSHAMSGMSRESPPEPFGRRGVCPRRRAGVVPPCRRAAAYGVHLMTRHSRHRRPGHRNAPRTFAGMTPAAAAFTLGGVIVGVFVVGAIVVLAAEAPVKPAAAATAELGGAERYLTYVGTDKPVYRIGERVYVRAPVLRADTRAPLAANQQA